MTIVQLRSIAEGLVKRANLVVVEHKQDTLERGRHAIEKLYDHARDTLPITVRLFPEGEAKTWADVARLANAIVIYCDEAEPRNPVR